jgi:cAMP phosphodiesterase
MESSQHALSRKHLSQLRKQCLQCTWINLQGAGGPKATAASSDQQYNIQQTTAMFLPAHSHEDHMMTWVMANGNLSCMWMKVKVDVAVEARCMLNESLNR